MTFEEPKPTEFERRLRFGCGFAFGFVVVVALAVRYLLVDLNWSVWVAGTIGAIAFGALAVRCGDPIWHAAARWLRWL